MLDRAKTLATATWERIRAACFGSLTIAWSYVLTLGGTFLQNIDAVAAALGDPSLSQQVAVLIGGDPLWVGRWAALVGVVTTVARLKSILIPKKSA